MFEVTCSDIQSILTDYHILSDIDHFEELQRYHYERKDPSCREVRLIIRVFLVDGRSVVVRFKNEEDVSLEMLESQCRFAQLLYDRGIPTPVQYQSGQSFARWYTIGGYQVIVTVEEFAEGEIRVVDQVIAEKTGALLARTHNIAEECDIHVTNDVIFDPFKHNDLLFYTDFAEIVSKLEGNTRILADQITGKYQEYMEILLPLRSEPHYTVQGDISQCNLYQTADGEIELFDFNRSGDNNLYCDAVMQAIFEARLMDYPDGYAGRSEGIVLPAFLSGYQSVRPFTVFQRQMFPYLYALIDAFWSMDIVWSENSLQKAFERGDMKAVEDWLQIIWQRISHLRSMEELGLDNLQPVS